MTTPTLAMLKDEEAALVLERFSLDDAWTLGHALREAALARHAAVAIEIAMRDRPLFYTALPGADVSHANWVRRKRNTVLALGTSTLAVGMKLADAGQNLEERYGLSPAEHASDGGGFPLRLRSLGVIGAITVSGMPSLDDHRLVTDTLHSFLDRPGQR
ncbi:MAG TPA: heme-degrading domain-containing protein [Luteibacter sp.]|nr:heme-degrading domain-containing protein [Luteibacter sp.]